MDILRNYAEALELYRTKKFDEALKLVKEIEIVAPHWKKIFLLKVFIRREQGEFLKEFFLLQKLLPRLNPALPEEKNLAAEALSIFGEINRILGMTAEAVESSLLSASLSDDNKKACTEISNALFAANTLENFSIADFRSFMPNTKNF